MTKTIETLKEKSRTEVDRLQGELLEVKDMSKQREDELETYVKEKDEEIKNMRNKFEKEMAIYKQKIEFKDV